MLRTTGCSCDTIQRARRNFPLTSQATRSDALFSSVTGSPTLASTVLWLRLRLVAERRAQQPAPHCASPAQCTLGRLFTAPASLLPQSEHHGRSGKHHYRGIRKPGHRPSRCPEATDHDAGHKIAHAVRCAQHAIGPAADLRPRKIGRERLLDVSSAAMYTPASADKSNRYPTEVERVRKANAKPSDVANPTRYATARRPRRPTRSDKAPMGYDAPAYMTLRAT